MLPAEPSPREQQASFIDFLTLLLHDEVERRARRARNADDRTNRDYPLDTRHGFAYTPECGGDGDGESGESSGKAGFSGARFFFSEAPRATRFNSSATGFGNSFRSASSVVHSSGSFRFVIGDPHEPHEPHGPLPE
jgi:hypothetical protein